MHNGKVWTRTLGPPFYFFKEADNTSPVVENKVSFASSDSDHHCDGRTIKPIGFFTQKNLFPMQFNHKNTLQTSLEH
jgi:hypothetical protein